MDSDANKQPTKTVIESPKASDLKRQISWPDFCKKMLAACLLGLLLGIVFHSPLQSGFDHIDAYLTARKDRSEYGRELPEEMHTILTAYSLLRGEFYRSLPPRELLNGALVSINTSCEIAAKKGSSSDKSDKQKKETGPASPTPQAKPDAAAPSATPSPSPSAAPHSAAQTYQNYAKILAEALHDPKIKLIYPLLPEQDQSEKELLKQFTQTILKAMDDGRISKEKICYSAINGMTMATADPYSTALDKDETRELNEDLGNEEFCGIGVYIEADMRNNKQLTVIEPIEGSPAAKAGMRTGDCITSIDGRPTKDMTLELAAKSIRGPEGSKVSLTISRPKTKEFTLEIERQKVAKKSVTSQLLPDKTGYVRLRFFGNNTGSDCHQALLALIRQNAQAIVLDLRNNPGGAVDEAITVASQFLNKDQLVTSVETPRINRHEVYNATGDKVSDLPLTVLINGYSASASEIVAGAIKDHKRGILVGETTFGKGSVQLLRSVGCGMALKFTIAHYLTPNLRDIHLKGIEPDVVCEAPYSNRLGGSNDKQLQIALRQLAQLKSAKPEQKNKSEQPSTAAAH